MSRLGAPSIAASSSSGRKPTTSLSWFGISMPTTSLPGIGASMRIDRAASAIARSSASASIRDSFTWASGRTSYCVTTGPLFVATTLAGIWKLSSFSSIRRMFQAWSTPAPARPGARSSSISMAGSAHWVAWSSSASVGSATAASATATDATADAPLSAAPASPVPPSPPASVPAPAARSVPRPSPWPFDPAPSARAASDPSGGPW